MDVFLARQPIFDTKQKVYGYEILYRSGLTNKFDEIDGDEASRAVIFNTFQTFGVENLTNGRPVFINFTENLINDEIATLFSREFLVVEILENVEPNQKVIENSRGLKDMGYRIALDDFIYSTEYEDLIELADIVKIDFLISDREEITRVSKDLKKRGIELLAEKVETREDFEFAKELGFTLFQGYFFSKPEVVISKKIKPIKATALQLVNEVNRDNIEFMRIANIISRDLSLTYNLLKLVNSAAFGFRHRIKTVKHAVVALGEREIKKWIYLVVLNDVGESKPDELTRLSLVRARFAELIGLNTRFKKHSEDMFLLGLFSLLDTMLNKPIENILYEIQASDIVRDALVLEKGEMHTVYKMIIAYERAEWDNVFDYADELNISCNLIAQAYMDALLWYKKLVG